MSLSLLDLAVYSEKRRHILLALDEKNRSIEEIGHILDESPSVIRPNVKQLIDCGLVVEENGTLRLSEMAFPVVENLKAFLVSLTFFENSIDYWKKHDLTPIPNFLLLRLEELGRFELIEPEIGSTSGSSQVFLENIRESKEILTFCSIFHPASLYIHTELAEKGANISLCMTEPAAERFFTEYPPEAKKLFEAENSRILICRKKENLPVFTVTDRVMAIKFSENNGKLSSKLMICREGEALEWGRELYKYYESVSERYE